MTRKISHCHKHIAKIAKELAAASYSELMSQDMLYSAWKRKNLALAGNPKLLERKFVRDKWALYVPLARATLVGLLSQPNNPNIDEKAKEEIMEILVLDSSLIRGRNNPAILAGQVAPKH